jgi:hypothetical protein
MSEPKQAWIMVKPHNFTALKAVFDPRFIPTMRLGDQLPVTDRSRLAVCLRYWRRLSARGKANDRTSRPIP